MNLSIGFIQTPLKTFWSAGILPAFRTAIARTLGEDARAPPLRARHFVWNASLAQFSLDNPATHDSLEL
jgi:hypothetical protein